MSTPTSSPHQKSKRRRTQLGPRPPPPFDGEASSSTVPDDEDAADTDGDDSETAAGGDETGDDEQVLPEENGAIYVDIDVPMGAIDGAESASFSSGGESNGSDDDFSARPSDYGLDNLDRIFELAAGVPELGPGWPDEFLVLDEIDGLPGAHPPVIVADAAGAMADNNAGVPHADPDMVGTLSLAFQFSVCLALTPVFISPPRPRPSTQLGVLGCENVQASTS